MICTQHKDSLANFFRRFGRKTYAFDSNDGMKNKSLSNNEGACWTLCVIGLQVIRSTIPDTPKSQIDWHKNNKTSQIKSRYTEIIPSEQESMLVFAVEHFKVNWNVRPYCVQTKWIKKNMTGNSVCDVCVCERERNRKLGKNPDSSCPTAQQ